MPNWKSYEATVRLLSAIVAAHPNLKLDYAAISKYYGDESNYHQIWRGMNGIKRNAESLRKAVDAGLNASTVNLENDFSVKKAISLRFGGDCTASALDNRFRRLKSDAKLINAAVAKGEDPILINVGDTNGEVACKGKEVSVLMGSATPASHIQSQLRETIKPLGERLIAMRDAGEDCKDVDLTNLGTRRYKAEIAAKMGSDVTPISVKAQFSRSFRVLAARQNDLCAVGKDPKDASLDKLGSQQKSEVAEYMGSDVTPTAIKMQYNANIRVLSRRQIALFDAETARIMGSDTTASSPKNHFRRTVRLLGSRQVAMLAAGEDSKDASFDGLGGEMDKFMGDSTIKGLRFQFDTRYKVIAKRQKAMLAAGKNPSTVDVVTGGKTEVQMCFGSDSTVGGIKFQFATTIKKHVDQIRSARAAGKDCKDITFNSNGLLFYIFHFNRNGEALRAGAKVQKDAVLNGKDPKDFDVALNPDPRKRGNQGECSLKAILFR
ncbi:hypothetical protein BGAL_0086g00200 [Botrytis galanthina]|uniref:Uncharacterized protein n=1 Tax=Botrytis galanthina TaxID=278940 RepID=A0A4S8R307_9HELO|nr:hypothetical protein BGAL_0086g00200 [Botrytis galanthina]